MKPLSIFSLCFVFILLAFQTLSAQEPVVEPADLTAEPTLDLIDNSDEGLIHSCVDRVFDGMLMADSAMVASAFLSDALLQTVYETEEDKRPRNGELAKFLEMVSQAKKGFWIEKTISRIVQVNGSMAHVWMEYEFYLGDQYLHCGVNSFQLVKIDGQWKITYLCDNRRESCDFNSSAD